METWLFVALLLWAIIATLAAGYYRKRCKQKQQELNDIKKKGKELF
jgi:hypothetical protein